MRYFEIARPPVRYVLADANPRETAPGQRRNGTIETAGERCLSNLLNQNQSAVTSMAFITPAFAIAQGNVCPRNGPQPSFSCIIRQTISDACCQSASDGSSVVAMVTSASPELRTVM